MTTYVLWLCLSAPGGRCIAYRYTHTYIACRVNRDAVPLNYPTLKAQCLRKGKTP